MSAKTQTGKWALSPDRCFDANPVQRKLAHRIYATVQDLPIVSPHGHVSPALLSDPNARFGSPADLFIIPDHYVYRLLYSRGINLADLGVPTRKGPVEGADHRKIWQVFAENFYLFRGTPTGLWLADELTSVFGVDEKLNGANAQAIYDHLERQLARPEFSPRALFKRFNIEVLCTTDAASDTLAEHKSLRAEGITNVRPTFRPDAVINLEAENWSKNIEKLAEVSGYEIDSYATFIRALQERRAFFKMMGATSTDQAALDPYTERLPEDKAEKIFIRALRGKLKEDDAARFMAHMIIEMARMSTEDGLVMQLHAGSFRNHNAGLFAEYGTDKGADIPVQVEWTHNLYNLLNEFGNDPRLTLILFGLDESTYSRELAPLAGHYPAVLLGPPWWFHDSVNGMVRYLDQVTETASLYNTSGFNDDTRAFVSIPARHDVWRRVTSNWLAGLVNKGLIDLADALEMAQDTSYRLAKRAYRLE
jgi:glucuronate isomerase